MHWYCLHTKPLKEAQVVRYCTEQLALDTYFPQLRRERLIRRQRKTVTGPLFPRYFFCRFDPQFFYRAVRYAPDVLNIVSAGSSPAIVADTLIEELKRWASSEDAVITLHPPLRIGDRVQVTSGPLQGLSGILLSECDERDRVMVLLSILQCGAQLNVERSDVRLIA